MNCKHVQHRLLAATDPRRVPASLVPHLSECAACRDWHARLSLIERSMPLVPVAPPSPSAKTDLIRRFEAVARVRPVRRRSSYPWPVWGGSLAASLLILALGGWLLFGSKKGPGPAVAADPPDPLLAKLLARNVSLAKADTPARKAETLGDLADDLFGETRNLALVAG